MIVIKHTGNFSKTLKMLKRAQKMDVKSILDEYGRKGVRALSSATPVDTGLTANSWGYETLVSENSFSIVWTNTNVNDGVPVALVLQYGHGTGTGGYVQGRDYINPAIQPIFDEIANEVWRKVTRE